MSGASTFDPGGARLGYGAIDIVVNVHTPEAYEQGRIPVDDAFRDKVRHAEHQRRGVLGWPWHEEMIAVAFKHPNVHLAGDAYAPKHWPESVVHFANTFGQNKFMFGTDFSVIEPERAMQEVEALGFRPEPLRKILRDNALGLFKLPG